MAGVTGPCASIDNTTTRAQVDDVNALTTVDVDRAVADMDGRHTDGSRGTTAVRRGAPTGIDRHRTVSNGDGIRPGTEKDSVRTIAKVNTVGSASDLDRVRSITQGDGVVPVTEGQIVGTTTTGDLVIPVSEGLGVRSVPEADRDCAA